MNNKFLIFIALMTMSTGISSAQSYPEQTEWKKGDNLGAKVLCTDDYRGTCFKMPARTTKVSECFYKKNKDLTGELILPSDRDYAELLAYGSDAEDWDCKEKEAWLVGTDIVTYASTWGGICAGASGNVPLATLFAVTALHAWVVEKAISRVPCDAVNTDKHDDALKGYVCDTVKSKSRDLGCDTNTLKINRKRS